jgi:dienelactone hydrolase
MAPAAALLASRGYLAAVLSYMGEPGLPASFQRIPVETVGQALTALCAEPEVDPDRLGVWAVSIGTALALSALSGRDVPSVRGVVVFSPTSVVWQGANLAGRRPGMSSLTRDGADLPWLPMYGERLRGQLVANKLARWFSRSRSNALAMLPAYGPALRQDSAENAAIAVDKIDAPILAVAGDSDAMWPSALMATELLARRQQQGHTEDRLLLLPYAGHFLRPPATPATVNRNHEVVSGGTPEGIAHGQREAWRSTLDFLAGTLNAD